MDATIQTALRLHEQGIPRRTIAKRAGISLQKVRKTLITAGAWSDETSEKSGSCNAIRVRNSKRKAKEKALTCTDTAQNEGSGAC